MKGGRFPVIGIGVLLSVAVVPNRAEPQEVTIDLTGEIPASCQLTSVQTDTSLGAITEQGTASIPFQVRCNTPFAFSVTSRSGALKIEHAMTSPPGFTATIPYSIVSRVLTNLGPITGTCASTALKVGAVTCAFPNSGQGVALSGDSSLTLSWQVSQIPLAGIFSDVLTLSVGPIY
jgi:hypothetical protein